MTSFSSKLKTKYQNAKAKKLNTKKKALTLLVVIVGVSFACQFLGDDTANDKPAEDNSSDLISADAPMEDLILAVIEEIDISNPLSLAAANDLLDMGPSAVPALLNLLNSPDALNRWAGMYALNLLAQPEDIPQIALLLDDPVLSIRARVAATLLMQGDTRGIPILEEALQSDQVLIFSHPPMMLSEYATLVLEDLHPEILGKSPSEEPDIGLRQRSVQGNVQLQQGLGGSASLALIPLRDITVSVSDCIINIILNLQFNGPKATNALAANWRGSIMGVWDQQLSSYGCSIDMVVNTKVDRSNSPTADPNYAQIRIIDLPSGYRGHIAEMKDLGGANQFIGNEIEGTWDYRSSGLIAAHEIGHVLGLVDEYKFVKEDGIPIGIIPLPSLPPEIQIDIAGPGDTNPSIMYQADPDKEGDYPLPRVRHIDQFLVAYKLSCACHGLVEWEGEHDGSFTHSEFTGQMYTCDGGDTWIGIYESLNELMGGLMVSQSYGEFTLVFENDADLEAEAEFETNGTIIIDGNEIGVVEQVILGMILRNNNGVVINIASQGAELIVSGGSYGTVQDLLLPAEEDFTVIIEPYEDC